MDNDFDESKHLFPIMNLEGWQRHCKHPSVTVEAGKRQISCELCGSVIDPFQFLHDLARDQQRFRFDRKALIDEIRRKEEELDELKREIRNARALLKRRVAANLKKIGGQGSEHAAE